MTPARRSEAVAHATCLYAPPRRKTLARCIRNALFLLAVLALIGAMCAGWRPL